MNWILSIFSVVKTVFTGNSLALWLGAAALALALALGGGLLWQQQRVAAYAAALNATSSELARYMDLLEACEAANQDCAHRAAGLARQVMACQAATTRLTRALRDDEAIMEQATTRPVRAEETQEVVDDATRQQATERLNAPW